MGDSVEWRYWSHNWHRSICPGDSHSWYRYPDKIWDIPLLSELGFSNLFIDWLNIYWELYLKVILTSLDKTRFDMNAEPVAFLQFMQWQTRKVKGSPVISYWIDLQRQEPVLRTAELEEEDIYFTGRCEVKGKWTWGKLYRVTSGSITESLSNTTKQPPMNRKRLPLETVPVPLTGWQEGVKQIP